MATTLTISITPEDFKEVKENKHLSASKLFRHAMQLYRRMPEFLDFYCIFDYYDRIKKLESKIQLLSREIERRNERIESLQDVLAKQELLNSSSARGSQ